jgi:hypothetical protein
MARAQHCGTGTVQHVLVDLLAADVLMAGLLQENQEPTEPRGGICGPWLFEIADL